MFALIGNLNIESHCAPSFSIATPAWPRLPRNLIHCYLQTLTLKLSLIILLHLSPSCHLLLVGCISYHILVRGELSDLPTQPQHSHPSCQDPLSRRKESGRWGGWRVGSLLEIRVCFLHQPQPWESNQGKSRSSNLKSLRLTSDKLRFHLPQWEQCLEL